MTIVAEKYRYVVGVDTHARTHTFAVIDTQSRTTIDIATFPTTHSGQSRSVAWINRRTTGAPVSVLVAIEGIGSFGAQLAQHVAAAGFAVVESPSPERKVNKRAGKTDAMDSERSARAAANMDVTKLRKPRQGQERAALRVLVVAREEMARTRTAALNALIALLRTIDLGIDARKPLTMAHLRAVAAWRSRDEGVAARVSRAESVRLAGLALDLGHTLATNKADIEDLVKTLEPRLLEQTGVGPVSAAIVLAVWSHPGRVRSEAALAALAGTCPVPASSGNTVRYRLNRGGDRRLNRAINTIAMVRMHFDEETKAYVAKRTAEGRTKREIMRSLNRYVTRQLYRTLATNPTPTTT